MNRLFEMQLLLKITRNVQRREKEGGFIINSNDDKGDKIERVLALYTKLINGYTINKREEAQNYSVNEKSIQRDIDDIRNFLGRKIVNMGIVNSIFYDRA